jgi:hypothetical protein
MKNELSKYYSEFNKHGILLLSDSVLPSLVTLIAEEPVRGSWWGHPKGNLIYNLSQILKSWKKLIRDLKHPFKKLRLMKRFIILKNSSKVGLLN